MLEESIINDQTAIEKIFCEPMEKLQCFPMDDETSKIMIVLLMSKGEFKDIPEEEKPFMLRVIESRREACMTFKFADNKLPIFLAQICKSPGEAVMYLWYLQYWCFKHNVRELPFEQFCADIFPWGFPSEQGLHDVWTLQKVKSRPDNLLDFNEPGKSIQFQS